MSNFAAVDQLMNVGLGFRASKTLLSAVELELLTVLAKGPKDQESLERELGLHPRSSRDFFDALVALGFLQRPNGKYQNTPATQEFLDKRKSTYIGGMLEMANARLYGFWDELTDGLRTGAAQNETKRGDVPFFETLYAEPDRLRGFPSAKTGLSRKASIGIASKFPWGRYMTAVDVGTAQVDLSGSSTRESAVPRMVTSWLRAAGSSESN